MRRSAFGTILLVFGVDTALLGADVLVLRGGSRSEVKGFEIVARAVHIRTLNNKDYSIIRDAVDVEATLRANRMTREETTSPGWKLLTGTPPSASTSPAGAVPPETPPPGKTQPPPPVSAVRPGRPVPDEGPSGRGYRYAFFVNGAMSTSPLQFAETRRFELFKEEALIDSRYRDPTSQGLELGGRFLIKGPLGLTGTVEMFSNDREAAFEAFLPHPFFFDRYREISGGRSGLRHDEKALHVGAVLSKTWASRLVIDLFGGPSVFFTRTEVLADVDYAEVYPYNTVIAHEAEYALFEEHPLGYNLGASATYRIVGSLGIDLGLRFSRGRVRLHPSSGGDIEFDAGGLRAGAGIRLLFR